MSGGLSNAYTWLHVCFLDGVPHFPEYQLLHFIISTMRKLRSFLFEVLLLNLFILVYRFTAHFLTDGPWSIENHFVYSLKPIGSVLVFLIKFAKNELFGVGCTITKGSLPPLLIQPDAQLAMHVSSLDLYAFLGILQVLLCLSLRLLGYTLF